MLDAAARARLLARHGAAAEAWLEALPTSLSALAERWWVALDLASPPLAGRTSVVVRGRLDGAPVMLKLAFDPDDAAVEAEALRAWGGGASGAAGAGARQREATADAPAGATAQGAAPPVPRLLKSDAATGALLLEAIVPGTALIADPAPPAIEACATLLRALRAPAPPAGLPSLQERVAWIFELWLARHAAEPGPRAAVSAGLLERGRDAARERATALAAATGDDPDRLVAWCAALAALDAAALAARPAPPSPAALAALLALAV